MDRLVILCSTYALCGLMEAYVGSLRGLGYSVMPMIVSLVGACGLRLVWIATIFQIPRFHTIQMLYVSYPVSWFLTTATHAICFLFAIRKLRKRFADI